MPIQQACYVIMQVCEGLDYAHNKRDAQGRELNLVHRDISPQNVLIGYEGEVKLIDFGIAKATTSSNVRTRTGFIKGKFAYVAPEYIAGQIDPRVDLFAAGVVAHELLAGRRLFQADSMTRLLELHVIRQPTWKFDNKISGTAWIDGVKLVKSGEGRCSLPN
jgi:serine/threonine-protein kinase